MVKVYVLETGCYENHSIAGVYATPELAMAAHSPARPKDGRGRYGREYGKLAGTPFSYEWSHDEKSAEWNFGADWDDAASIIEYEVEGS